MKEEREDQRLHFYTNEEVAKENVELRKELASLKEENAKLKAFVKKTLDSAKSGLEYFEIQKEVKDLIG